jgi:hypothetical protein
MMSAFLVEDKTLHKILSQLRYEIRQSNWLKNKFEKELNLDFFNQEIPRSLLRGYLVKGRV